MSTAPPQEVVDAIQSGITAVTRRVEVCEADGKLIWMPDGQTEYKPRLIDGAVAVNYNRDERRTADFSLDNKDNLLRPEPTHGFWYDKIIKAYRGVKYPTDPRPPRIAIVEYINTTEAYELRSFFMLMGNTRTDVLSNVTTLSQVREYDIIVSYTRVNTTTKATLLRDAFYAGKGVITIGCTFSEVHLPFVLTSTPNVGIAWNITPVAYDTPLSGGWTAETAPTIANGNQITAISSNATRVAQDASNSGATGIIALSDAGGRWFHFHPHRVQTQGKILLGKGVQWIRNFTAYRNWEVQIGEFMIDKITEANRPKIVKVNTRDYTKKMLNSKLEKSLSFAQGTPLEVVIASLAANTGITKMKIPASNKTLPARVDLERSTPRWAPAKDICNTNNFELYFDAQGYLTMRPFLDPSFSPIAHTFKTGKMSDGGNLVAFERSTNDSELFNHVVVTGERSTDGLLPFFGEAKNTTSGSPTRIDRIGDRMYPFSSTYFESDAQCLETAQNLLKLKSLESYEISFNSITYPWLEVGEIVELLDPDRLEIDPTRFLLDTLSIPMGLGAMSGTSKRITFVEDPAITALFTDPNQLAA